MNKASESTTRDRFPERHTIQVVQVCNNLLGHRQTASETMLRGAPTRTRIRVSFSLRQRHNFRLAADKEPTPDERLTQDARSRLFHIDTYTVNDRHHGPVNKIPRHTARSSGKLVFSPERDTLRARERRPISRQQGLLDRQRKPAFQTASIMNSNSYPRYIISYDPNRHRRMEENKPDEKAQQQALQRQAEAAIQDALEQKRQSEQAEKAQIFKRPSLKRPKKDG